MARQGKPVTIRRVDLQGRPDLDPSRICPSLVPDRSKHLALSHPLQVSFLLTRKKTKISPKCPSGHE